MLTDRQSIILKIIVEEYVKTAEPVGSKTLSLLERLDCSPATIRNEMAELEELGFLQKTHTSSGRIPSEEGYRYYVHNLMNMNQEQKSTYEIVDEIFAKKLRKEELIKEAIKMVSQITNYASFATSASRSSLVKKIELIPISNTDAVILLVTDDGSVEKEIISVPENVDLKDMREIIDTLGKIIINIKVKDVSAKLEEEIQARDVRKYMEYQEEIIKNFIKAFSKFSTKNDEYYQSGQTNILELPEFNDVEKVKQFFKVIENKEILRAIDKGTNQLQIRIGKDAEIKEIDGMSVVSVPYNIGNDSGVIAVMGPTRMNYEQVITLLEYISESISKLK